MKSNRKEFIRNSTLLGLGVLGLGANAKDIFVSTFTKLDGSLMPNNGRFELAPLGYDYYALEPFIDAQTMEIHYSKHHQTYVNKLNEAIDKEPSLRGKSLDELLLNLSGLPSAVKTAIRNHGGGHWNHSFFWKSMKTGTQMGPNFTKLAIASFGSIETFKSTFEKVSLGVFGSGWAWLILQNNQLKISATTNQDNPLMDAGKTPEMLPKVLLGIDLWEHAYYLKHQNKRGAYVTNFWNVVNWDEIELLLK